MEVRTFATIKKVIWDQLLATKAEIIQSKLYFCSKYKMYTNECNMQSANHMLGIN